MIGIYCITNMINGKKYIGQSWDIDARIVRHKSNLNEGTHCNKHLQASWNKYSENGFVFNIERIISDSPIAQILLDCIEDSYIKKMNLLDKRYGYNKREGGSHGKMSDEAREKMSISCKQRPINWGNIAKMRESNIGRVVSEETKAKISKASLGKHKSEAHKASLAKLRPTPEAIAKRTATRHALGHYKWSAEAIAKREATKKAKREQHNG